MVDCAAVEEVCSVVETGVVVELSDVTGTEVDDIELVVCAVVVVPPVPRTALWRFCIKTPSGRPNADEKAKNKAKKRMVKRDMVID